LPPRDRVIPEGQSPGEPAELSLEGAEQLRAKREAKSAEWDRGTRGRSDKSIDPWGNWKTRSKR